jgi:tetratricopeptide (TPR) repeat protein
VPTLKTHLTLLLLASLGLPIIAQAPSQDDPRALMFRARVKQQQEGGDDPAGAVALYRKVITLVPTSSEAHLRLSEALAETGNLEEAITQAVKATTLNPKNAEAWVHLGLLQSQRASSSAVAREATRKAFLEASRLLPGDPEVWFRLAQIQQLLNDDEGALNAWLALGRLHPTIRFTDASLEEIAWERAAFLGASLNHYEARREAIMALCEPSDASPKHLRLLEDLAREQAEKGYLGHAEESFLLLGEHYPDEPGIWENVGRIQLQTGRFEEALSSYRHAARLKPSARASYFQGLCLMSLGRLPEAEAIWPPLLASLGTTEGDLEIQQNGRFFFAACLLLEGRPAEMLERLQSWPGSDDQPELAALKTQGFIQTEAWKAAGLALEDGMKRFPDQALFQSAKSTPAALLKEGVIFKKEARKALTQLDLESMASLWAEFRQWGKSLDAIQLALAASPMRRIDLLMVQSNALDQMGRSQEAIQVLREAQKLNATYPMLQNNLGYMLLENGGDLQEASRLIESAMKQDPKNGSTVDSWGWVLFKQGKLKEAEDALRKAVELTPYSPEIRNHLGEVLLKLNRPEEALEQWERALAYAFPERKELEEKVRKLRTHIAKRQSAAKPIPEATSGNPEDEPTEDEDTP